MAGAKAKTQNSAVSPERLKEPVAKAAHEVKKATLNEATESGKTFLKQLLGLEIGGAPKSEHAALKKEEAKPDTGGVIELFNALTHHQSAEKKPSSEKAPRVEAAMNYSGEVRRSSERAAKGETHELNQEIQAIKAELNNLLASSKVLQMEFATVSLEQAPVNAGEYHKTFLDWMLIVIRQARQKVEDSGAWLNVVKGKRGKKGLDVTNMSMHQSGERTTIQNSAG
jgi:hypothetical protein